MTTNEYFDQEMHVLTAEAATGPRAFALAWDTPDEAERQRRDRKLYQLATGPKGVGFGIEPERFKAAWNACREAWKADPTAFLEQHLETGSWFSAAALLREDLPELRYVVEGFLPQGLCLLASPPKFGKSWLALQLCLAVSRGQPFLGMPARQATCLYLALEDGKQRLQRRCRTLLGRDTSLARTLYFETHALTLADGLLAYLESFAARHPDCRLVVVDTLQKVRGADSGQTGSAYAADYADMGALKAFADRLGLCLLLVHHLRKMTDDADPFNRIAGSNGIFGAADAALVLTRDKREDAQTVLDLTGRDVEDKRLVLRFDKAACRWQSLGTPAEAERAQLAADYAGDVLAATVRAGVDEHGGRWQTAAKGFIAACEGLVGYCPVSSGQALAKELDKRAPLLAERDGIRCEQQPRAGSGRVYLFTRAPGPAAPRSPF